MTMTLRSAIVPGTLLLPLILSACGGGGGSAGDTSATPAPVTSVTISQSNYQAVGATAIDPLSKMVGLGGTARQLVGAVEVAQPSQGLADVAIQLYRRVQAKNSSLVAGVVVNQNCTNGGTMKLDTSIVSQMFYTVGDRIKVTGTNCQEPGQAAFSGTASFTITSATGEPFQTNRYGVGVAMLFDNFELNSTDGQSVIKGDLAVNVSQSGSSAVTMDMSGQALSFTLTAAGKTNTYRLDSYNLTSTQSDDAIILTGKYTMSGTSGKLGGSYSYGVEILQPLVTPISNVLQISGALIVRGAQASVAVTALNSATVRVDYSEKGDGVTTASNTLAWADFNVLD
ncbi:MAG: hypothetical protein V4724_23015 [Pseudomonadota bacterium]